MQVTGKEKWWSLRRKSLDGWEGEIVVIEKEKWWSLRRRS